MTVFFQQAVGTRLHEPKFAKGLNPSSGVGSPCQLLQALAVCSGSGHVFLHLLHSTPLHVGNQVDTSPFCDRAVWLLCLPSRKWWTPRLSAKWLPGQRRPKSPQGQLCNDCSASSSELFPQSGGVSVSGASFLPLGSSPLTFVSCSGCGTCAGPPLCGSSRRTPPVGCTH